MQLQNNSLSNHMPFHRTVIIDLDLTVLDGLHLGCLTYNCILYIGLQLWQLVSAIWKYVCLKSGDIC